MSEEQKPTDAEHDLDSFFDGLRAAGFDAWDKIEDPCEYIRRMREDSGDEGRNAIELLAKVREIVRNEKRERHNGDPWARLVRSSEEAAFRAIRDLVGTGDE